MNGERPERPGRARRYDFACLTAMLMASVVAAQTVDEPSSSMIPASELYDIELVVFRNLDTALTASPEIGDVPPTNGSLPTDESPSDLEPLAETSEAASPPAAASDQETVTADISIIDGPDFVETLDLPPERTTLGAIENALRRSASYRPLAHIGWSQEAQARSAHRMTPLDERLLGTGVNGSARLSAGRFLHLVLELDYIAEDGQVFTLRESRRMRSGERHYFDHPQFGAIAVVTRREEAG